MFEDEKIKLIEQMPDADTILIIWIKLLSQAGKTNASGYIYLSENIPYTDEMLATIFNRPVSTVRLALKTFEDFGMISIDNEHFIAIENWEKHQNVEGMERVRKLNAERNRRYRERKKQRQIESGNKDSDVSVTSHDGTDIELELELDIDKEYKDIVGKPDNIPYKKIVDYLNSTANKKYRHTTRKTKDLIKARFNEGFTLEDFKQVIDIKNNEWKNDTKMQKFIRPETLFGTKFESYLNQKQKAQTADSPFKFDPSVDSF